VVKYNSNCFSAKCICKVTIWQRV